MTFLVSLIRIRNARIDLRMAKNRRAVIIAKRNMRGDAGRSYRQLIFASVGVRAMLVPTPSGGGGSWLSALVACGFISLAVFDLIDSTLSVREQAQLLVLATDRVRRSRVYVEKDKA